MNPRDLFMPVVRRIRRGGRRAWSTKGRLHVQLSDQSLQSLGEYRRALESKLEQMGTIQWAKIHPSFGRVVVRYDHHRQSFEDILEQVTKAEKDLLHEEPTFSAESPEHPAEIEAMARTILELSADVMAIGVGGVLRLLRVKRPAVEVDVAALLTAFDGIPEIRAALERRFGVVPVEVFLGLATSFNQALLGAWAGLLGSVLQRYLRLREQSSQRQLWLKMESELFSEPAHFPEGANHSGALRQRPSEVPPGAIEKYSDKAVAASLGGFGLGLTSTHSAAGAAAAVFGGLPKPALIGREAFSSETGFRLAKQGTLVRDARALRRLDRINCLILDSTLLHSEHDDFGQAQFEWRSVLAEVQRQKLKLVIVSDTQSKEDRQSAFAWAKPTDVISYDSLSKSIRKLQRRGMAVCLATDTPHQGYEAADCILGILKKNQVPPYAAHMLAQDGLQALQLLLQMLGAANVVAKQSVQLALVHAAASSVIAMSGLRTRTTRRIMSLGNIANFVAVANGVRIAQSVNMAPTMRKRDTTPWHTLSGAEALERLGSSTDGLSPAEARLREPPQKQPMAAPYKFLKLLADELANPLTPILALGATLSALVGGLLDSGLVIAVILLNALIGAVQRFRVEALLLAMGQIERRQVRVRRRANQLVTVDVNQLVRGDVIELESGELVPADCRIIACDGLEVDESNLTGESMPAAKFSEPSDASHVAERTSMLYAGTSIASGTAVAVVVGVGEDTEMGRAEQIRGGKTSVVGVEERLEELTRLTAPAAALSAVAMASLGALRRQPMHEVVGTAVNLAVASVPEGLPMLATVAQLAAAGRLSERGALVRNPRAVEALGRVNVLCADKTGTLTEGNIRLHTVADASTSEPVGTLHEIHRSILAVGLRASPEGNGRLPHLTDQALVFGAREVAVEVTHDYSEWMRKIDLPFESGRGYQAVLGAYKGNGKASGYENLVLSAKGAPEVILPRCTSWLSSEGDEPSTKPLNDEHRDELLRRSSKLARRGLRVLAVAERSATDEKLDDEDVANLVFRGFVAFADPVRPSARGAVEDLQRAGVRMVMITGDHPSTAKAIARELGLPLTGGILTGTDLEQMSAEELANKLQTATVFARVTPSQKVRIVEELQNSGKVVAMAGDGANDAAAIRLADVGIALGEASTAAARNAADMVVADERIETLVHAVLEGRALWSSVRDAVALLVGGNLGEIAFTVLGTVLSKGSPLNTRQLLLVNLLTDVLPALAIAVQPPTKSTPEDLLREGPEASLGTSLNEAILWRAAVTTGATLGGWLSARIVGNGSGPRTVALVSLVGAQLGQTLVAGGRSRAVWWSCVGSSAVLLATVQTPGVSQFFGCRPLGPLGLAQGFSAASFATAVAALGPTLKPVLQRSLGDERLRRLRHQPWLRNVVELQWMKAYKAA